MTHALSPRTTRNGAVTDQPIQTGLACAAALRAACASLSNSDPGRVASTRVIATRGGATAQEVRAVVAALAEKFGLDPDLEFQSGSFTARFRRRAGKRDGQGS